MQTIRTFVRGADIEFDAQGFVDPSRFHFAAKRAEFARMAMRD